ncbi:MAG: carboxylesterase family protein [Bacteroidales bacterium]|nr:carboxylesterase family protein [Bacteroidales bacterium]
MKYLIVSILFILSLSLQAQTYRYSKSIFDEVSVTENVVYTNAPSISGFYNDESNVSTESFAMDIYEPVGDDINNRPAIIFIHGGAFVSGNRKHDDMEAFCDSLAHKGYVTATIDYRLGMYVTSNASATRAVYRGLQDGRSAVRFLKANAGDYGIDPAKIYMAGSSAGAFICLHSVYMNDLDEKPDKAGSYNYNNPIIPFNQITAPDLGNYDIGNNLSYDGAPAAIFCLWGALQNTSLIKAKDNIPIFLVHGTADGTVPFGVGPPFGLSSFSDTYGSSPISTAISQLGFSSIDTWFVDGEGHEFYGVSNGNWSSSPNDYWGVTVEKAASFFHDQHKPKADFSYSSRALDVVFSNESTGAPTWYWDFGDGETSRLENPDHSYSVSGTYIVTLHVENKIKSWDESIIEISVDNTGIQDYTLNQITTYPNPVRDILVVNNLPSCTDIEVFSVNGTLIKRISSDGSQLGIDMKDLPVGMYIINFSSRQKSFQQRVLKTK